MLIVNPHATSTTPLRRDVIARDGYRLVLTLGGDGTANEAVNGLLRAFPPDAGGPEARPALAALPGGSANVFTRALGMPSDPVDATGRLLAALTGGGCRTIGVGLAQDRYFTINAGLGLDAEVVRAIEGLRADGQEASAGLYVWTAIRHFYGVTNRRQPALALELNGRLAARRLFFAIVSNAAPWTYLGSRPVNPNPEAGFNTGLDVFAARTMGTLPTLGMLRYMLGIGPVGPGTNAEPRHILSLHDEHELTFRAIRPIAFQVDGEYVGEREHVTFRSVPDALRVIS
jgi:diacylglycerol kinase family enzyme